MSAELVAALERLKIEVRRLERTIEAKELSKDILKADLFDAQHERDDLRTELQTIHVELSALTGCATDEHNAVQMASAMRANLEQDVLNEWTRKVAVARQRDAAEAERDAAVAALEGLRIGRCWCEVGVGNPMVRSHSPQCIAAARAVVARGG